MDHHAMLPLCGGRVDLAMLFAASLLGSAHCVGMCGPYVAMCTAQFVPRGMTPMTRLGFRLLFNLGRIITYCLIGLSVGAFGQIALAFAVRLGLAGIMALASGMVAAVFGVSMIGWLKDPTGFLVRGGVGRLLKTGRMRLNDAPPAVAPLLMGSLQGLLPCAMVYAAASRAAIAGTPGMGALTMGVFGLGTVPAIFALTVLPQTLMRRIKAQRLAGLLFVMLGVLLILRGLASFGIVPATRWW
jgi:sulfite exporter TauE/SafE